MNEHLLKIENLSLRWDGREILWKVNLKIHPGILINNIRSNNYVESVD